MDIWREVLDSCPGLLCSVINLKGRLIYATKGYKAAASRLFGHECSEGRNYPPMITEVDRALHGILTGACLGRTNSIEVSEGKDGKIWGITASPLRLKDNQIFGVVLRIVPSENAPQPKTQVIQSSPDILNSVPFRAAVVNQSGEFLAVNKFLAQSSSVKLTGHSISEFIENSDISEVLMRRSGCFECSISGIREAGNFYTFSDDDYLDKDLNAEAKSQTPAQDSAVRNIRIHASPIKWDGSECVMLTFEDFTDLKKTSEQLRRVLTFDNNTGVLNRRGMEHVILRDLNASIKHSSQLSLIILKIDNFREILEGTGYLSGSRLLRDFVRITKRAVANRQTGVLGRWSDDEFAVLAQCSGASAVVLANDIRLLTDGVKLSAGVADLNSGAYYGVNDFVAAAYDAMIDANKSGGNQTKISRR
ncbi:MAG: GGDEF domain-containing protein [Synergistaceae bacterium]|nr:GGDEF domain-containing protein [Synergistaceae bacterium]